MIDLVNLSPSNSSCYNISLIKIYSCHRAKGQSNSLESAVICDMSDMISVYTYLVLRYLVSRERSKRQKTYNSRYSLVVTHPTTNLPISSLCMAERTGCPVLLNLWSYVLEGLLYDIMNRMVVLGEIPIPENNKSAPMYKCKCGITTRVVLESR